MPFQQYITSNNININIARFVGKNCTVIVHGWCLLLADAAQLQRVVMHKLMTSQDDILLSKLYVCA